MFRVLKTRQARRSAVASILPFVERSRAAREIPGSLWFDPYFVGFLGMLITLSASWNARTLSNDSMADVQSKSWAEITGMSRELIGDEICSLSAAHDERFELGCRNALSFFQALQSEASPNLYPGRPEDPEQQTRNALWARYFDTYVTDFLNANEMIRI